MPFLSPNQQRQSTEGKSREDMQEKMRAENPEGEKNVFE